MLPDLGGRPARASARCSKRCGRTSPRARPRPPPRDRRRSRRCWRIRSPDPGRTPPGKPPRIDAPRTNDAVRHPRRHVRSDPHRPPRRGGRGARGARAGDGPARARTRPAAPRRPARLDLSSVCDGGARRRDRRDAGRVRPRPRFDRAVVHRHAARRVRAGRPCGVADGVHHRRRRVRRNRDMAVLSGHPRPLPLRRRLPPRPQRHVAAGAPAGPGRPLRPRTADRRPGRRRRACS